MTQPLPPPMQRFWLLTYAILSSIYRVFVSVIIMLVVAFQLPVIGVLMAIGMGITFVVVPIVQVFKYLTIEPELHRKRGRAIAFTGVMTAIVVITFGLIRFPYNVYANGVVQATQHETVRAGEGGFVHRILAHDGQWMRKGETIVILQSDQLDKQIAQAEADARGQQVAVRQAMTEDATRQQIEQDKLNNLQTNLKDLQRRRDELTIKAPFDGVFVNPTMHEMEGRFVGASQPVGMMLTLQDLEIRAILEQNDKTRLDSRADVASCQVRLASEVGTVMDGSDFTVLDGVQDNLSSAALGTAAGGEVAIDPTDPPGTNPLVPQFEVRVRLDNPDARFLPGQRATVRFQLKEKYPLIAQWSIRFWQLIQTKSAASQW
jgi:putative peptide zinc metalloprotease protein